MSDIITLNGLEPRSSQSTAQLKEELQPVKLLMDLVEDAVFWVEPDARLLHANDAACCLVEFPREELLSMSMYDLALDFSPSIWSQRWRSVKQHGSLSFELLHKADEYQRSWVKVTLTYLKYCGKEYSLVLIQNLASFPSPRVFLKQVPGTQIRLAEQEIERSDFNARSPLGIGSYQPVETELARFAFPLQSVPAMDVTNGDSIHWDAQTPPSKPTEAQLPSVSQTIFPNCPRLNEVFQFIEENYHKPINLSDVAQAVGYSPAYLTNLVKCRTQRTIHCWIVERRMVEARSWLLETDLSVKWIAAKVGYPDAGHFARQFRKLYNLPPKVWRSKYQVVISS